MTKTKNPEPKLTVRHYKIKQSDDGSYYVTAVMKNKFDSIEALIDYYKGMKFNPTVLLSHFI